MDQEQFNIVIAKFDAVNKTITDFHGDFQNFKGSLNERVKTLEREHKSQKFWSNVKVYGVIPVMVMLHQIAAHLGWIDVQKTADVVKSLGN